MPLQLTRATVVYFSLCPCLCAGFSAPHPFVFWNLVAFLPLFFISTYSLNHLHFVFVQLALALFAWMQCDSRFIHFAAFIVVCLVHVSRVSAAYCVHCFMFVTLYQTISKRGCKHFSFRLHSFAAHFVRFIHSLVHLFTTFFSSVWPPHQVSFFLKWNVFLPTSYIFRYVFHKLFRRMVFFIGDTLRAHTRYWITNQESHLKRCSFSPNRFIMTNWK